MQKIQFVSTFKLFIFITQVINIVSLFNPGWPDALACSNDFVKYSKYNNLLFTFAKCVYQVYGYENRCINFDLNGSYLFDLET